MVMSSLAEYPIAPGRVRDWRLDARPFTLAAARSAREGARETPSYNQEWHLRFLDRILGPVLTDPPWMGFALELPGPFRPEAFRLALQGWAARHDVLRSAFLRTPGGGCPDRITVGAAEVAVRDTPLGASGDPAALVEARLDAALDPYALPSIAVETVEHPDATTVVIGMDHTHGDAYSALLAVDELAARYAGAHPEDGRPAPRYADYGDEERAAAAAVGAEDPAVAHWSRFAGAGDGLPAYPLPLGVPEGRMAPREVTVIPLLDAGQAAAVEDACRTAGGFLVGLLAAHAVAVRELTGGRTFRTIMPVHTRTRPEWAAAQGWFTGLGPVETAAEGDGFRGALPSARRAAGAALRTGRVPFLRALEVLGIDGEVERRMPDAFPILSYLDARTAPGADRWAEGGARILFRACPGRQALTWVNRTHRGVDMTVCHPSTPEARRSVPALAGRVRDVLADVAKHGDHRCEPDSYTPNPVPRPPSGAAPTEGAQC